MLYEIQPCYLKQLPSCSSRPEILPIAAVSTAFSAIKNAGQAP
jgi:hypothetical protein